MSGGIDTAVVRVLDADGTVLGAGFLLAPDLLCTCAHVLPDPETPVTVDFPLLDGRPRRTATVLGHVPPAADNRGDLALLKLTEPAPPEAVIPWLAEETELWERELRVFGFPTGRDDGLWAVVRSLGRQGTGWVQLEGVSGARVQPGFSGAPLWDADRNCVVGFVVAVDAERTAYMHPTAALFAAWPELRPRLHPPNPYRGLATFTEADAAVFHGRADDLRRLAEAVHEHPVVAVTGGSGSGKSSLVHAGLLPQLRQHGTQILAFRANPATDLPEHPDPGTLIFADQFEELVAADPEAARTLLTRLTTLAEHTPARSDGHWGLRVVLTLRPDGLETLLTADNRAVLAAGQVLIPPMSRAQLNEVITGPLTQTPGVTLESGLAEKILDDAGTGPCALPLLGFALHRLWNEQGHGNQLQHAVYHAMGGVSGALQQHADAVYQGLSEPERVVAQRLLTRMTRPLGDHDYGRRPLPVPGLTEPERAVLATLTRHKLVVQTDHSGQLVADLAHEALIRHWRRLRAWLDAARDFHHWHDGLRGKLADWTKANQERGALLRGSQLTIAQEMVAQHGDRVNSVERAYIELSSIAVKNQVRMLRWVVAVIAVLALIATGLTVVTVVNNNELRAQTRQQAARLLAQQALRTMEIAPDTSALTALAAWNHNPDDPEAFSALLQSSLRLQNVAGAVPVNVGGVKGLASSADGRTVAVRGPGGEIEVTTGLGTPASQQWIPPGVPRDVLLHEDAVSPDGRWLARLTMRGAVLLWDIRERGGPFELRAPITDPRPEVEHVRAVFSPDSERLFTHWSPQGRPDQVSVWEVARRTEIPNRISTDLIIGTRAARVALGVGAERDSITLVEAKPGSTLRNFREHIVRRSISTGALLAAGPDGQLALDGMASLHCVSDPERPDGYRLEIRRVPDGRIERTASTASWSCNTGSELDATGRYLVLTRSNKSQAYTMEMVVDLRTGKRVVGAGPPVPTGDLAERVVAPEPDGSVTVLSPSGKRLLRTVLPQPGSQSDYHLPKELRLVATSPDDRYALDFAVNAKSGRLLDNIAAGTGKALPERVIRDLLEWEPTVTFTHDGSALAIVAAAQLVIYDVPALTERHRIDLPIDPRTADIRDRFRASISAVEDNSLTVVHAGVASRWDPLTGRLIDAPVVLRGDRAELRWLAVRSAAGAVPKHPGWHVVLGKDQRLELWDLGARRRIREFPGDSDLPQVSEVVFNHDGSRMAALYGENHQNAKSIRVWDIATGTEVHGRGLVPNNMKELIGLAPSGHLISRDEEYRLQIWHPSEPVAMVALDLPGSIFTRWRLRDNVISGFTDLGPFALKLAPQEWFEQVCKVVRRPFQREEAEELPKGADTAPPCG